jgi:hypothetical protein
MTNRRTFREIAIFDCFKNVTRRETESLTIWDEEKFLRESPISGKGFVRVFSGETAFASVLPEIRPFAPEKAGATIEFSSRQHS